MRFLEEKIEANGQTTYSFKANKDEVNLIHNLIRNGLLSVPKNILSLVQTRHRLKSMCKTLDDIFYIKSVKHVSRENRKKKIEEYKQDENTSN